MSIFVPVRLPEEKTSIITADRNTIRSGRVFYKIFHGGLCHYSLLFSNIVDYTLTDSCTVWVNALYEATTTSHVLS